MWRRVLLTSTRRAAAQCLEPSSSGLARATGSSFAAAVTRPASRAALCPASGHAYQWRQSFASAAAAGGGGPASLEAVLKAELAHEVENYDTPELVKQGPPEPFDLHEEPGGRVLTLTRRFGDESVTVTVSVEDEPEEPWGDEGDDYEDEDDDDAPAKAGDSGAATAEDEDEDEDEDDLDDDDDLAVFFDVRVSKRRGQVLHFQCVTDGVNVDIVSVQLVGDDEAAASAQQDAAYGGPEFSTLDVALQDAFAGYLAERGVDHVLAEYLVELSIDKEQREYTNWLKGCAKFVGSGK